MTYACICTTDRSDSAGAPLASRKLNLPARFNPAFFSFLSSHFVHISLSVPLVHHQPSLPTQYLSVDSRKAEGTLLDSSYTNMPLPNLPFASIPGFENSLGVFFPSHRYPIWVHSRSPFPPPHSNIAQQRTCMPHAPNIICNRLN